MHRALRINLAQITVSVLALQLGSQKLSLLLQLSLLASGSHGPVPSHVVLGRITIQHLEVVEEALALGQLNSLIVHDARGNTRHAPS